MCFLGKLGLRTKDFYGNDRCPICQEIIRNGKHDWYDL
jgi:hypothetical protein